MDKTGRCLKERLRGNACNVRNGKEGFLALHMVDLAVPVYHTGQ